MKRPIIFAHRGANTFAPENTLSAFEEAIRLGCDGIELDIRFTADREIVVFHDRNALRMTGQRLSVQKSTLRQIKSLKIVDDKGKNHSIPTLEEVLDLAGKEVLVNIDLKKESVSRNYFEETLLKTLRVINLRDNIIISSFNPFSLKKLYALNPSLHYGFIFRNRSGLMMLNGHPVSSFHPRFRLLSRRFVRVLQEKGAKIYSWTVEKAEEIFKQMELGVDGIITNRPEVALDCREKFLKNSENEADINFPKPEVL
ncbi:MAG: glycerophosphodiester phosphodiesterase [Calditrichia bacterium]